MAPLRGKRDVQRARSPAVRVAADKAPSCRAVPLVQSARGGGEARPIDRTERAGTKLPFFPVPFVPSAEAKEQRRNQEKTNLFVSVLNVLFGLLPETKRVAWNFEGCSWKKNRLCDT